MSTIEDIPIKLVGRTDDLEEPVDLMFYIGNRSGLRAAHRRDRGAEDGRHGLPDNGLIRARFSYDGPLKEDKMGTGKVKWGPAADDAEVVLGPWLDRREAQGAGPEDLVFPCARRKGSWYRKEFVESRWEDAAPKHSVELTWYQATRHTFTSRALEAGATLDEVSAALGHSSPVVTRRYYDHFVRKSFSPEIRRGLGIKAPKKKQGEVVPMRKAKKGRTAHQETEGKVRRRKRP